MMDVGKFYVHWVYFMAISYILWPFGIGCWSFWDSLPVFGALYQEKSGNPTASRRPPSLLVFKADFQALGGILLFPLLRSAQYSVRNLSRARESKKNRRGRSGGKTCRMHAHGDQMRLRKFANKSSKNRQKIAKSGQKSRKKVANSIFVGIITYIYNGNMYPTNMLHRYFCNFQKAAVSKQSSTGRKFAQSGHPGLADDAKKTELLSTVITNHLKP
jgi:hypothetical protein